MLSFTRIIKQFVNNNRNNRFLSHHHYQYHHHSLPGILRTHVIINVIGDKEHVDQAAEEIKMFSQEKNHQTVIITNSNEKLRSLIFGVNILQVIINKCYNMSCYEIKELHYFTKLLSNFFWKPQYVYVMPNAVNRLVSCDFVKKCEEIKFVYPLAATQETKKTTVDILID